MVVAQEVKLEIADPKGPGSIPTGFLFPSLIDLWNLISEMFLLQRVSSVMVQ